MEWRLIPETYLAEATNGRVFVDPVGELRTQGLTDSCSDFLQDHGPLVQMRIKDSRIKAMNVWIE